MNTIPKPKTPPFIQLANWMFRPMEYMETNFQRHGDLFFARFGILDWIFVSHPEALKQILTQDTGKAITAPGEANELLSPLLGKNSVTMLNGTAHRQRRKLIMPPFHGERLKVYADLIKDITLSVMSEMTTGQTFRARDAMQKITMRVILQAVFGLYDGDRCRRLEALLTQRLNMLSSPTASILVFFPILQTDMGNWSPGAKIAAMDRETNDLLYAEIRERRAKMDADRNDILSLLLQVQDEDGNGLSDEELRDELMTLLVAGHETTATALAWSLYWTHHHPQVKDQVRQEIQGVNASNDAIALTKLPYLEAVCNETLRIYPVGMLTFARQVHQPMKVLDYTIPEETMVVGCIYLLHHREDLYPQSYEFRPERFLERQYSAFEFMPFGNGARRCVGAALAMYELKIALGTILTHYNLELESDRPAVPERRGLTLGMKGGVEMVFQGKRAIASPVLV